MDSGEDVIQKGPVDPMTDTEHVLALAVEEIRILRRRNEQLEAKMDVYDTMVAIFRGGPPRESVGYRQDPLQFIEKKLASIRYERQKQFNANQGESSDVRNAQAK